MNRIPPFMFVFLIPLLCYFSRSSACSTSIPGTTFYSDTLVPPDSSTLLVSNDPDVKKIIAKDSATVLKFKTKKIIAAILSFPVPFGLLGLHRIFLGTKPYIPFVYMGTLGGCFLVLPIIDFIAILSANEETFKHFENNPKVFMWAH